MGLFDERPANRIDVPLPSSVVHAELLQRAIHGDEDAMDDVEPPLELAAAAAGHPMWAPTW
jgi:hypothetical protein